MFFPFSALNQGFTRPQGGARAVSPIFFVLPVVLIFSFYYLRRLPPEGGKPEPDDERSDRSERTQETPGDESLANVTPSEGVSPDKHNASNKTPPPPAEPGLQILHDSDAPKIDIVAVHGLGANPDYAWVWLPKNNPPNRRGYPDKPFNWLQEILPGKLPKPCRVLTFNYDSRWFRDAPQQKLSSISDTLLDSLRNDREQNKAIDRPLIFIGHSFGGNVIEQAIVSASRHRSPHLSISASTIGVVFLGTPHRGSPAATWGAIIASLMPSGLAPEDRLLKALEKHSDSLADRLRDFSGWLFSESVPVVCAFEQLVTDYSSSLPLLGTFLPTRTLVVDEDSACIDGHHKISLQTDHLKINKYYGADDPSFKLIYPEIQRMVEDTEEGLNRRRNPKPIPTDETSTSGTMRRCLQQMRVKNPEDILSKIDAQKGQRVENTCEWILKREEFSAWAVGTNSHLLRLIGSPGIGKTMMATFLVQILKCKIEKNLSETFVHFFCDDKDQERKTPTAVLRSLVWQLLLQRNELFELVQPDLEKHECSRVFESLFGDIYALRRILKNMLLDERSGKVFILIDALDECEISTRKDLLSWMKIISQPSPAGHSGKIKILLTCRPQISDIEDELQDVGTQLQMGSAEINHDLAKYIDDRVDELATKKRYPLSLKQKVIETLKREAGNTFLWVSLMVAELNTTLMHKVEEKLNCLPQGLYNTYSAILDRVPVENRENAQFILRFMVAALRPLSKTELQAAYATWKTNSILSGKDMPLYADILSVCSSILHVGSEDDASLNFCHQSVKDFLLDEHTVNTWYHTNVDEANIFIFRVCWMYLSAEELKHRDLSFCFERLEREIDFHENNKPKDQRGGFSLYLFLKYSYSAWKRHAIISHEALLRDWHNLSIDAKKAPALRDALLYWITGRGCEGLTKLLLDHGANVDVKGEFGATPLLNAVNNRDKTIVKLLLDRGANIETKDETFEATPLFYAVLLRKKIMVKLLLDRGANIEATASLKDRPLLKAAQHGCNTLVKFLLDRGANIEAKNILGITPLLNAAWDGHESTVNLLLDRGADIEGSNATLLLIAIEFGRESAVKLLLDNGANIEARGLLNNTPLLTAAWKGLESMVKLLLDHGANIKAKNIEGQKPLSIAADEGHMAVVKLLLDNGADIETRDIMNNTPLLLATKNGHKSTVKLLLARGANIKAKNYKGQTPLAIAADRGHMAVVKLLEQYLQR